MTVRSFMSTMFSSQRRCRQRFGGRRSADRYHAAVDAADNLYFDDAERPAQFLRHPFVPARRRSDRAAPKRLGAMFGGLYGRRLAREQEERQCSYVPACETGPVRIGTASRPAARLLQGIVCKNGRRRDVQKHLGRLYSSFDTGSYLSSMLSCVDGLSNHYLY